MYLNIRCATLSSPFNGSDAVSLVGAEHGVARVGGDDVKVRCVAVAPDHGAVQNAARLAAAYELQGEHFFVRVGAR